MTRHISFVFPMYNESLNISKTLERARHLAGKIADDYEIIVVDDASTDDSAAVVERLGQSDAHIRLVRLQKNTKFGGALNAGLMSASKDIILYTDADFPAKEEDIRRAIHLLDKADIVTAYSMAIKDASLKRIVMSKVYNFLVEVLFGLKIHDINSGLKIYRKKVFEGMVLKSESPFIDVEIFAEAKKRAFTIAQYGLVFDLRTGGVSTISRLDVVWKTFSDMLAYRLSSK